MLPAEGALFSPSVGEGEIFRRSCGVDAGGEIDPLPKGGGIFALGGRGNARCGVQGRAPPGARGKRGQDTKVSCPLLRLPNFPLSCDSLRSRV